MSKIKKDINFMGDRYEKKLNLLLPQPILLCHTSSLHVLLNHNHEPSLRSSSENINIKIHYGGFPITMAEILYGIATLDGSTNFCFMPDSLVNVILSFIQAWPMGLYGSSVIKWGLVRDSDAAPELTKQITIFSLFYLFLFCHTFACLCTKTISRCIGNKTTHFVS